MGAPRVSALADRPMASGLTLRPLPAPQLGSVSAAEHFFIDSPDTTARRLTIEVPGTERWLRPWFVEYVEAGLNGLLELRDGWDGRRARAITTAAAQSTVEVLAALMNDASAPPQLFPLPDGGIQAEWHVGGNHIEVEIDGDGEAHILAQDIDGAYVAEGIITPEHPEVLMSAREFLQVLSARFARVPVSA
jgi:hypothetical protein